MRRVCVLTVQCGGSGLTVWCGGIAVWWQCSVVTLQCSVVQCSSAVVMTVQCGDSAVWQCSSAVWCSAAVQCGDSAVWRQCSVAAVQCGGSAVTVVLRFPCGGRTQSKALTWTGLMHHQLTQQCAHHPFMWALYTEMRLVLAGLLWNKCSFPRRTAKYR